MKRTAERAPHEPLHAKPTRSNGKIYCPHFKLTQLKHERQRRANLQQQHTFGQQMNDVESASSFNFPATSIISTSSQL